MNISQLEQGHESEVLAARALVVSGTLMHFIRGFCIRGIPGQSVPILKDFGNPYDVPDQRHIFQCLTSDIDKYKIKKEDEFSIFLHGSRYDFRIRHSGIPDATAWSRIEVDYLRRSSDV